MEIVKDSIRSFCEGISDILFVVKQRIIYTISPDEVSNEVKYLREQIAVERKRVDDLIQYIIEPQYETQETHENEFKPLYNFKPFRLIRNELESKYRKDKPVTIQENIDKLEKELEIRNA